MKTNKDIKKELEELAPNFSKLKKENPFQVPHNYFKEMQAEVLDKINTPAPVQPNGWSVFLEKIKWLLTPRPAFALAGLTLLIAAFFIWNTNDTTSSLMASADVEAIEVYIEENIEDFDSDLFLDLAMEEGIQLSMDTGEEDNLLDELLDDMDDDELLNLF